MMTVPGLPDLPARLDNLVIISAPSGSGKTTLVKRLLIENPWIRFSISTTTRQIRPGEIDGSDYYFTTVPEFQKRIEQGAFVEYAQVHHNYYGTAVGEILRITEDGYIGMLDIDVQGFRQIMQRFPRTASIFVAPPSLEVLKTRLINRGTDSEDQIEIRLETARQEMKTCHEFGNIIINDKLNDAYEQVLDILHALPRTRNS